MAKSGKSNKATDKEKQSVETPENAENVISELETELSKAEENVELSQEDRAVETSATDTVDAAETVEIEEPETVAEVLEEEVADTALDTDSETEQALTDEAETDPDEISPEHDPSDMEQPETDETGTEIPEAEDVIDPEAQDALSDEEEQGEVIEEPEPEPVETKPEPEPKPAPQAAGGSIWPGVFGGVIAALIGFIVGRGDALDDFLPAAFQRPAVDLTVVDDLAAQTEALAAQAADLATQTETQVSRIDALEAVSAQAILETVTSLEADLETVATRLEALEARPLAADTGEAAETNAASADEVAGLKATLEEQKAQIADLVERAEAVEARAAVEASQILARAALTRVVTAVDSGQSFAPALTDLEEVTPVEVPAALREAAESGVPSLAALQDSFPDAARAALAAARNEVPESEVEGITGFLKRQLNVRSVTPREGSDPDAILSRAQAAVRAGDLGTALSEMEALPDAALAAMADWLDAATARKAAQDAANELADSLNSN